MIICGTVIFITISIIVYKLKLPENNCQHEMETIQTRDGKQSTEYLSTCKKCGFQRTHFFSGLNYRV